MALLADKDRKYLKEKFLSLDQSVKLVVFTQEMECEYCRETRELVEELAGLSDKINVEVITFDPESEATQRYRVDKIPAIALIADGEKQVDYGIRFYGIPSGYEFSTLIEGILMVSAGDAGLTPKTKAALAQLTKPVHLQVFITPTCPYCPRAVHLAHQMAMASPLIRADMVEAIEFPHLANKYHVMGVPRTVINDDYHIEGSAPEGMVLAKMLEALAN